MRESFVNERLGHRPDALEAMDLTSFMHGGPGRLLSCNSCGTLLRDEDAIVSYENDNYDSALLTHLYPRYLKSFAIKRRLYGALVRPGAEVLEVGSHLGAFLQNAEEWGWRPIGLDVGVATTAFARRQGATVKRTSQDDYSPKLRRPEAIFIWNCFEQLEDPVATLKRSHQLLDRNGLLVLRVPNAEHYLRQRVERSQNARNLLGYNNLLGFPYLHGYTPASLNRLLRDNHFQPIVTHNSSLLTPPYPDMSTPLTNEWCRTRQIGETAPATTGPWLEVVSRRATAN